MGKSWEKYCERARHIEDLSLESHASLHGLEPVDIEATFQYVASTLVHSYFIVPYARETSRITRNQKQDCGNLL